MSSLVERVAARHVVSAFIPDKFFKQYEAELKKILAEPLKKPAEDVPYLIHDRVVPLFKRFAQEIIEIVPQATETMKHRLDSRVTMLEKLATSYFELRKSIDSPYPIASALDEVLVHTSVQFDEKLEKAVPTLGRALKIQWFADADKIRTFVKAKLKKATPRVIEALLAHDDWSNDTLKLKHDFYVEFIDKGIGKFLRKEKVTVDISGWFTFIREVLASNYAEKPRYRQFDLNGMKVVIDDETVAPEQHDKYVKYLDAAYNILKKKKLGRAWYGTVYVECESCGGVNHNTGGGTGGHFNIQKDHVKIFSRPGPYIIDLMCHELGHRYWFKSMSSSQRAKFESLVRAYRGPRPEGIIPKLIDPKRLDNPKREVEEIDRKVKRILDQFLQAPVAPSYKKVIDEFEDKLSKAGWDYGEVSTIILREVEPGDADSKALYKEARLSSDAVMHHLGGSQYFRQTLDDDVVALPDGTDYNEAFKRARAKYVDSAKDLVSAATVKAYVYMDRSLQLHNEREHAKMTEAQKQRQTEWDADAREIVPVSDYGRSNIDEAFAEVFAHYCLDVKMNADQEASFKAVLLDKDRMASTVAARWLGAGVNMVA